ncbi:MAG: TonB-dependent receptor plug domain-containing protein, partial [Emcibacteraceae bacterium]|nr:TonB-dependent receptor plug domain-containing protein [Emcibacteraceae bacterium]
MKFNLGNNKTKLMAGVSAISLVLCSGTALAQDAGLEEEDNSYDTIVTVGKRPENVLTVPVAMTAYDAAFMDRVNLDDVKDLIKFSPGFAGDSKDSFIDFVNIRGISTIDYGVGGDPSVGFFKNNLYQGRQGSAVTSMFDMQRAEVLRGPQGFLFGRNAISGAISFHTARPEVGGDVNGYVEMGVGERGIWEAEAAVNLPVSDNFAIRVAGYTSHENGWMTNTLNASTIAGKQYGGHDKTAGRFSAAMEGEKWDAFFVAEYEERDQDGTVYRAQNGDVFFENLKDTFGDDI